MNATPEAAASGPEAPKQTRSLPKNPVTRAHVDAVGRGAAKTAAAIATAVVAVARYFAGVVSQTWTAIHRVPVALRRLSVFAILTLLGIVGAIALPGAVGTLCAVVIVPVCAVVVGALGRDWFGGHAAPRSQPAAPAELARSVAYVDSKLALALNHFGSDRHEQAVIALFQAKTAAEFALGTEDASDAIPAIAEAQRPRPRIQAGPRAAVAS